MFEFIKNSAEYIGWGFNSPTITALITAFLTLVQGYGVWAQARGIWKKKNADSVSEPLFAYSAFYFFAFIIYSIFAGRLAMLFNGLLGFLYIPIIIGICKFKRIKTWEWIFTAILPAMIFLMYFVSDKDTLLFIFLIGSLFGAVMQVWEVFDKKRRGNFNLTFLLVFLITNVFWLIYGVVISNWEFEIFNSASIAVFLFGLYLYIKYPNPPQLPQTAEKI